MTNPISIGDPASSRNGGWTRGRVIFLSISAVLVVTALMWAREVLLPFILAIIIAYVLTPLVERCERLRVPRAAAILLVYAITLGSLYGFGALAAGRIAAEGRALVREVPKLLKHLQDEVIPEWEG
ncbi:MAG TPA: AI-2E family transporter, partial [Polyangiaceae bacterium]|nr:AI-2E family transporter [Polyangiaceae bacterium]